MALDVEIRKQFGDFRLEVCFSAGNGVLALAGKSGSGKSLTLRCIAGIQRPDEGKIVVDGETWFDSAAGIDLPPQRRRAGLMLQNYALFPNMTVLQNLMAGMGWEKDKTARRNRAEEYLARFGLEELSGRYPRTLSGGQQQRTALARMLAARPRVLLLDEPFSALDPELRWEVERETSRRLAAFGGTTLLVSHDRSEVYRSADYVAVYHDGRVDVPAETRTLFERPETEAAARFTGCRNILPVCWSDRTATAGAWGLSLTLPEGERSACIGIPQRSLTLAPGPGENTAAYTVAERIEEERSCLWRISVLDSAPGHLIYWETDRETTLPKNGWLRIPPEQVLRLRRSGTTG